MTLICTILITLLAAAHAQRSPHADLVESLGKTISDSRYSNDILEDALLNVPNLIKKYKYPVEVHEIVTSDGYILQVHRIPHGRDKNKKRKKNKPVVFLMHGLLSSSADYLVLGPGTALAYVLAEEGYDVWMGNARGNFYSRKHLNLNPDSLGNNDFWLFSWDEIGYYDLPAIIDHILKTTGQKKIHYIGHSQGGTSFLVLNSLRPEYNEKFISFQGLAPASFFIHNDHSVFQKLAPYGTLIEQAALTMGIGEIFGNREAITWFGTTFCVEGSLLQGICSFLLINGDDVHHLNATMVPLFLGHAPAGASIRQVAHYGQGIKYGNFRRFNFVNPVQNLLKYGRLNPPEYKLSKITVPSYIHYSIDDVAVHFEDCYVLSQQMPNVVGIYRVERPNFSHLDFVWANDVKSVLYDKVIKLMRSAEANK